MATEAKYADGQSILPQATGEWKWSDGVSGECGKSASLPTITGSLTQSISIGLTSDGTNTTHGALTKSITVGLTNAGTVTTHGSLTKAISIGLSSAGTNTTHGALTKSISFGLSSAGTIATHGTFTKPITVSLSASGNTTVIGALSKAINIGLASSGTNTGSISGSFIKEIGFGLSASGANRIVGSLTKSISFGLTAVGFGGSEITGSLTKAINFGLISIGGLNIDIHSFYTGDKRRIKCDLDSHALMLDSLTSITPIFWRGTDWQIDFAFYLSDLLVYVLNYASLTLEVKPYDEPTAQALLSQTLTTADLDNTLTDQTWNDGTKQHARFSFLHNDTNLDLDGKLFAYYFLCVKANTTDVPSKKLVLGTTKIRVDEGGVNDSNPPTPGDPDYYTKLQADARFVTTVTASKGLTSSGGLTPNIALPAGTIDGQSLVWNASSNLWIPGSPGGTPTILDIVDGKHRALLSRNGVLEISDPID